MTPALAQIMCDLEAAVTEREAMVADNMQLQSLGIGHLAERTRAL